MDIPRLEWTTELAASAHWVPEQSGAPEQNGALVEFEAALADAIDRSGCCVVEGAAPAVVMDAIASELAEFEGHGSVGASDFEGHATRRTGAPLPRSATFRSIATHPAVMAAGDQILDHATSWRFSAAEYIEIGAGESAQRLHRDQWKYDMVDFEFEVELNGMWAVTDFTERNGATRVVPGSHRLGNREKLSPADTLPAEMAKGSLLFYTGSLYHGGGQNQSESSRARTIAATRRRLVDPVDEPIPRMPACRSRRVER